MPPSTGCALQSGVGIRLHLVRGSLTSGRVPKMGDRQPSTPTSLNISHIRKGKGAASAIKLLGEWMADESGYDEETWPDLKVGLERARLSNRKLFDD